MPTTEAGIEDYFAAHMITHVDEEGRHRDLPSLQARHEAYIKQLEKNRDSEIEARLAKLEEDLAQLESEGAKADIKRKVSDGAQKEAGQLRNQYQSIALCPNCRFNPLYPLQKCQHPLPPDISIRPSAQSTEMP